MAMEPVPHPEYRFVSPDPADFPVAQATAAHAPVNTLPTWKEGFPIRRHTGQYVTRLQHRNLPGAVRLRQRPMHPLRTGVAECLARSQSIALQREFLLGLS